MAENTLSFQTSTVRTSAVATAALVSPAAATSAFGLRVRGLRKRFRRTEAIASLDLDAPRGRLTGVIGPDGAGKSTALQQRILRLLAEDEPAYTNLTLVAELDQRAHYLNALHEAAIGPYADLKIITFTRSTTLPTTWPKWKPMKSTAAKSNCAFIAKALPGLLARDRRTCPPPTATSANRSWYPDQWGRPAGCWLARGPR